MAEPPKPPKTVFFFRGQQNFVKRFIQHPCARPWYIWVETFIPAFIKLYLTVTFFDVADAIRARGQTLAAGGEGVKGKKHAPKIKTTGKETRVDRYAMKGLKTLLVVTAPLEFIGFHWLLYSAVDQFFWDWQTLLDLSDFCKAPIVSGPLQRTTGPAVRSLVVGGIPVILPNVLQNRGGWPSSSLGASLPEGIYISAFALTVVAPANGFDNLWVQIVTTGLFTTTSTRSDPLALRPGETGSLTVVHDFFFPIIGGGGITWEIGGETIPAGVEVVKGHFICQRTG